MIPEEVRQLVDNLLAKSREREVNWVHTSDIGMSVAQGGIDFTVTLPEYSINVWKREGSDEVFMALYDEQGRTIYKFEVEPSQEGYDDMNEIVELARRKALHVDEALKSVSEALSNPGVIGEIKETGEDEAQDEIPF